MFEEKDQIWIVFDRDERPKIPETFEKCRNNNIGVAFSNPCFELWIILHFEDFDKVLDRHKIQEYLGSICEFYKKHKGKRINFSELINNIDAAEDRAKSQKKKREAEAPPLNPPYTTVYDLTEAIRKASQKHKKK